MKRFAGSVGTADIYFQNNLIASANTLTDSTITISTTQDEIRGGMYAPVQFTFTHDASIKVALTDIVWNRNYLMLQLGSAFSSGDSKAYTSETVKVITEGTLPLSYAPVAMDFGCGDLICLVSYRKEGDSGEWNTVTVPTTPTPTKNVTVSGLATGSYCVRYAYDNPAALKAAIYSHIVPAEVRLVIRAPLFAGDACSASSATNAGEVQYVLPRFRFDGNVTINGAMSSNSTMALNGTALAFGTGCDMYGGKLMDIIEITPGQNWDTPIQIQLGDSAIVDAEPDVYFVYATGDVRRMAAGDITGNVVTVVNIGSDPFAYTAVGNASVALSSNVAINLAIPVAAE